MTQKLHVISVYGREARAQIVGLLRTPQFLLPSVALPIMFYALFGVAFARGHAEVSQWLLATYVIFAAIAPSMFGFGAGVAAEREAGLIELKRVSPMPGGAYIFGKLAASLTTVAVALTGVALVAGYAGVHMTAWRWPALLGLGLASALPFSLIGLNIGLRLGAQSASALANFLFLVFSMLGGLWVPLTQMPSWMTEAAWFLPSFHLGQLSLMLAGLARATQVAPHVAILAVTCLLASAGAWAAWRRDPA